MIRIGSVMRLSRVAAAAVVLTSCGKTPTEHPTASVSMGERVQTRLVRLDDRFGTTGRVPTLSKTDPASVSRAVQEFVHDRLQQKAFYGTTFKAMFLTFALSEIPDGLFKPTKLDAKTGAIYVAERTPCGADAVVDVEPWWAPDTKVRVCTDAYRPDKTMTTVLTHEHHCSSLMAMGMDDACGCGPNLVYCAAPGSEEATTAAIRDEPLETARWVVTNKRPFSEILTLRGSVRSNLADIMYARNQVLAGKGLPPAPAPEQLDQPRDRYPMGGGVLTASRLRYFDQQRAITAGFCEDFLGIPFKSVNVSARQVVDQSQDADLRSSLQLRLTTSVGCQNCHARLENAALAFHGFPDPRRAQHFEPQPETTMKLYVNDHNDLRGQGPATPEWLASQWVRQPEFTETMVRKVEELVFGGNDVPEAVHVKALQRFRARQDFEGLVADVVTAWIENARVSTSFQQTNAAFQTRATQTSELKSALANACSDCHAVDRAEELEGPSLQFVATQPDLAMKAAIQIASGEMPPVPNAPLGDRAKHAFYANACSLVSGDSKTCMNVLAPGSNQNSLARTASEVQRSVRREVAAAGYSAASKKEVETSKYLDLLHRSNLEVEHYDPSLEIARILLVKDLCKDETDTARCVAAGMARKVIVMPDQE
jgi:hypothetical protein